MTGIATFLSSILAFIQTFFTDGLALITQLFSGLFPSA
jgi:hypothetical protein